MVFLFFVSIAVLFAIPNAHRPYHIEREIILLCVVLCFCRDIRYCLIYLFMNDDAVSRRGRCEFSADI